MVHTARLIGATGLAVLLVSGCETSSTPMSNPKPATSAERNGKQTVTFYIRA